MPERPGNDTAIFAIVGITSGMKARYVALYDLTATIYLAIVHVHMAVGRGGARAEFNEIRLVRGTGPVWPWAPARLKAPLPPGVQRCLRCLVWCRLRWLAAPLATLK